VHAVARPERVPERALEPPGERSPLRTVGVHATNEVLGRVGQSLPVRRPRRFPRPLGDDPARLAAVGIHHVEAASRVSVPPAERRWPRCRRARTRWTSSRSCQPRSGSTRDRAIKLVGRSWSPCSRRRSARPRRLFHTRTLPESRLNNKRTSWSASASRTATTRRIRPPRSRSAGGAADPCRNGAAPLTSTLSQAALGTGEAVVKTLSDVASALVQALQDAASELPLIALGAVGRDLTEMGGPRWSISRV
jgi:hypothetical protein